MPSRRFGFFASCRRGRDRCRSPHGCGSRTITTRSRGGPGNDAALAPIKPLLRRAIVGVGIVSACLNVLLLAGSLYMMLVYDFVIPGRSIPTLVGLLLMVVAAYVFQGMLDAVRGQLLTHLSSNIDVQFEAKAHDLVLTLARLYPARDAGQPIRDIDQVRGFLGGAGPTALVDLPWVFFFVGILFLLHPWLGFTVLVGAIVLIVLTVLTERTTQGAMADLVRLNRERQQAVDTSRRHAEAIHAMGMQGQLEAIWRTANGAYRHAQVSLGAKASRLTTASRIFRLFLQSGVLTVGALLVLSGKASGGVIFASSILSSRALAPIEASIANWRSFVAARQSWQRLGEIATFDADRSPEQVLPPPSAAGAHDAIVRLPSGYDTMLGDPDQPAPALSVQQRIAWARALFEEPFLVLLDNPGSFQDSDGHAALRRCLAGLRARGAVTIVVGDTSSVIDSADRVLVMRKGGMVDYGLKEDVRARLNERQRREAERLAAVSVCADPLETPVDAARVE